MQKRTAQWSEVGQYVKEEYCGQEVNQEISNGCLDKKNTTVAYA